MANDVSRFKLENDSAEYNFSDAEARAAILDEIARAEAAEQANATAISAETTRAEGVEGTLSDLTTTAKSNLVAAINEVDADVNTLNSKINYNELTSSDNLNSFSQVTGRYFFRSTGIPSGVPTGFPTASGFMDVYYEPDITESYQQLRTYASGVPYVYERRWFNGSWGNWYRYTFS